MVHYVSFQALDTPVLELVPDSYGITSIFSNALRYHDRGGIPYVNFQCALSLSACLSLSVLSPFPFSPLI